MFEIQDTDIMWRWYKRTYKGQPPAITGEYYIPDPSNICNYFWKAMWGACLEILWDTSIFASLLILLGVTGSLVFSAWWFELFVGIGANYSYWYIASIIALDLFYVFSIGFFGMLTLIIPLVKWFTYWENRPDICTISACVLFYICFGFLLSFADKNETWGWWCVLKGFMIETTIIIGVCLFLFTIYLFSPETSVGKTTWGYLKGVKDRVCPLVKAPESFEKEKRDAMTNCGDG